MFLCICCLIISFYFRIRTYGGNGDIDNEGDGAKGYFEEEGERMDGKE